MGVSATAVCVSESKKSKYKIRTKLKMGAQFYVAIKNIRRVFMLSLFCGQRLKRIAASS